MTLNRIGYLVGLGVLIWLLFQSAGSWAALLLLCAYLFVALVSIGLSFFNRGRVSVKLKTPGGLEQAADGEITLIADNWSVFSVPLLAARLSVNNYLTGTSRDYTVKFPVAGKAKKKKTVLLRDAEIGHVDVIITDLFVTDALRLIRLHLPSGQHGSFLVEPPNIPTDIVMGEAEETEGSSQKYSAYEGGHDVSETFDHRPYRPGDSARSVQWQLSAKADELIVRVYGKPVEFSLVLLAELAEGSPTALESCIAYTAGISRMLLEQGLLHTIAWYDAGTDEYCSYNVTDFESLEDALLRMIVSCPHEGNSISMERFLQDLTPSGRKKTVFYFTTAYNNDAMLQAADVCLARAAVIGPHGYDTRDEGLSVDLLPEDTRTVKSLHLNMEK